VSNGITRWSVYLKGLDRRRAWQISRYYPSSTMNLRSRGNVPPTCHHDSTKWWLGLVTSILTPQPHSDLGLLQPLSKSFLRQVTRHSQRRITTSQGHHRATQGNGIRILNHDPISYVLYTARWPGSVIIRFHDSRNAKHVVLTQMPVWLPFSIRSVSGRLLGRW
jgi:hypothetical protein